MSREDIQKLLGGYATGTLTPEERDTLFAAALEDQELFDSLVREEPLRELLQDPAAKGRLRAALEVPARARWYRGWLRPAVLTAAAAAIVVISVSMVERRTPPAPPVEMAKLEPAPPPAAVLSAPQPPAAAEAPRPSITKAAPVRQRNAPQAKDQEVQELKQATAQNQPAATPAAPAPLPAPPPVDTQAALQLRPVAGLTGIRAGAGGMLVRDARALFSEPSPAAAAAFRKSLVKTESGGPARAQAVSAPVADAVLAAAPHLGLRYTVWRRPADGIFEQTALGAGLNAGDRVELQLQANDSGYLYVLERGADGMWNVLTTDRLARMAMYTIPQGGALRLGDSGVLELFVLFARRPLAEQERVPVAAGEQQISQSPAERAMYVASTSNDPAAQRIGFQITLRAQSH